MLPSEMVILMAIAGASNATGRFLNRPMTVSGEYVGNLYDSLVRQGYLRMSTSKRYQLTGKGKTAMAEFLHRNDTRVKHLVRTIRKLGIEVGEQPGK